MHFVQHHMHMTTCMHISSVINKWSIFFYAKVIQNSAAKVLAPYIHSCILFNTIYTCVTFYLHILSDFNRNKTSPRNILKAPETQQDYEQQIRWCLERTASWKTSHRTHDFNFSKRSVTWIKINALIVFKAPERIGSG